MHTKDSVSFVSCNIAKLREKFLSKVRRIKSDATGARRFSGHIREWMNRVTATFCWPRDSKSLWWWTARNPGAGYLTYSLTDNFFENLDFETEFFCETKSQSEKANTSVNNVLFLSKKYKMLNLVKYKIYIMTHIWHIFDIKWDVLHYC